MQARIDVVVPLYNKKAFVERCVSSILEAAEATSGVSVSVVDNGSTDGSLELVRGLAKGRARIILEPSATIGRLRNIGAAESQAEIVCFLDADCVVPRGYFSSLRGVFELSDVSAAGCTVDFPEDGPWVERTWAVLHRAPEADGYCRYLNSANVSVRRTAFKAVNGFSESLVTGEDTDLGNRLNQSGYRMWETRRLAILHLDNPRTIRTFFRKQVWHALGVLGTLRIWPIHWPILMTVMQAVALIVACVWLALGAGGVLWRAAICCVLAFLIPTMAVVYRAVKGRRGVPWLLGIVLYQVYFLARIYAMWVVLQDSVRAPSLRSA